MLSVLKTTLKGLKFLIRRVLSIILLIISIILYCLALFGLFYNVDYSIKIADEISWDTGKDFIFFGSSESGLSAYSVSFYTLCLLSVPLLFIFVWLLNKLKSKKEEKKFEEEIGEVETKRMEKIFRKIRDCNIVWFLILENLSFLLSVAGIVLAIWYPKTGSLISLTGTVQQRVNERVKNGLVESRQMELKKDDDLKFLNSLRSLEEGDEASINSEELEKNWRLILVNQLKKFKQQTTQTTQLEEIITE